MRPAVWTTEEEEMLFGLVGDVPWSVVVSTFNRWAVVNGYSRRTRRALHRRVNVAGYSIKATGSWIDIPTIAKLLGSSGECVRRWARNGTIKAFREGKKYYVKRENLREFALQHAELFSGKPRDDLFMLLDDEELANQLADLPVGPRLGHERPIMCVETGKVYRSYQLAADTHFVTRQALTCAVWKGTPSAGYHWRQVEPGHANWASSRAKNRRLPVAGLSRDHYSLQGRS